MVSWVFFIYSGPSEYVLTSIAIQDTFEMQSDAILPGQSVIIVDDLIATGESRLTSPGATFHTFCQAALPRQLVSSLES